MSIKSKLYSLEEILEEDENWRFSIPIYQRLYVWGEDQVRTLLSDLKNAYLSGEKVYFLGGAILVDAKESGMTHHELIDGQQRFTTLWMLCYALEAALKPSGGVCKAFITVKRGESREPRLSFAIRPKVNRFMKALASDSGMLAAQEEKETERMRESLSLMNSWIEQSEFADNKDGAGLDTRGFAEFIFSKAKMVLTIVPGNTDLNKLFEVINNRGVQLQHHEILKARMLKALPEAERGSYGTVWNTCADMEEFVERSLSDNSGMEANQVGALYAKDAALSDDERLGNSKDVLTLVQQHLKASADHNALGLEQILSSSAESFLEAQKDANEAKREPLPTRVRSIFGFPLLLQHVLRIWLVRQSPPAPELRRLLDRELMALFEDSFFALETGTSLEDRVRSFIGLLWDIRYRFDKHIIKWVDQGERAVHLVSRMSGSDSSGKMYVSRNLSEDGQNQFSLLQSMLYHSQEITTQYWITPLLSFIDQNPSQPDRYFDYLRYLDNQLLGSVNTEDTLIQRTRAFLEQPWGLRHTMAHPQVLKQALGLKTPHYWFYKLEYVLWYLKKCDDHSLKYFRMTAKNSIEHVSPQTPKYAIDERVVQLMDNFGNLALVPRNINSEYSNDSYSEKKAQFLNKKKQGDIESLKMDLIYQNERWTDDEVSLHQDAMIAAFDEYWQEVENISQLPIHS